MISHSETKIMNQSNRYEIKVLRKALNILELFNEKSKELTATQISQLSSLHKSTAFRILDMLEDSSLLEKSPESLKYRLGFKVYFLGSLVEGNTEIRNLSRPFLETLKQKCNETVHLVVLHRGEALYLDKIEGGKNIRVVSRIGMKLPAHCSGVGKVLLAACSEETINQIIREKGLQRFTDNTITDVAALKAELARIRKQGYAIDNEEIELGLKCVAAPIKDSNDKVIAAISLSGPKERLSGVELKRLIPIVKNTATEISNIFKKSR